LIVLDTHALIWLDAGDRRLGRKTRRTADRALVSGALAVSAISFWEIAVLLQRRRIALGKAPARWRLDLFEAGLVELPLNGEIAIFAASLGELQGDPADRMIAATAAVHGGTLVTADRSILEWESDLPRQDARV
jgi:PIN domain nuclease of toxin-antitoxin system